jgi:hypothetical protein
MKNYFLLLLLVSLPDVMRADEIYLPPGSCMTVPPGGNVCADTLTVDTNACFIAADSSAICQGMVIRGGGTIIIAVEKIQTEIPARFELYQNFPNPFNPVTMVKFDIPRTAEVKLTVYDLLGREVAVLVNEKLQAGTYLKTWDAGSNASGIYYYKLTADSYSSTMKMVLVK